MASSVDALGMRLKLKSESIVFAGNKPDSGEATAEVVYYCETGAEYKTCKTPFRWFCRFPFRDRFQNVLLGAAI